MAEEVAVDGESGGPAPLPRRDDASRCPHTEHDERRCVLPPGHDLKHVYPHQQAVALCGGD
ncbi:hypothetical protein ABZ260_36140 [Streptosporangium sp. NPDC006013]|uniref:hypothetical protein n=1 Tax=Streptosporangium sp. NPDC006013 TaxID=3155596 RepID=UPI0033B1EF24